MINFTMNRARASLLATVVIAFVLLLGASLRYNGFFSLPVFVNLIDDNAFLGIAAIGMTFVILSGGIDLSVGAMIGATSIASALLVERAHLHPLTASLIVLAAGGIFGAIQGTLIARFDIAPFLVTLAGMFFLRGAAYTMSLESVALTHPAYRSLESVALPLGTSSLRTPGVLFFLMAALGIYVARHTRFGRGVYAIGGNAQSALLMGLPSKRISTLIYVVSGLCSALAGITYTIYTSSGSATAAMGLELDVIAAVVIGGTLLTGGQGSVLGTLIGVVILGAIQTIITFEGTLSSWWTRIVIGGLLFFFVALQRLLAYAWQQRARKPAPPASPEQDSRKDSNMTSPRKMAVVSISFLLFTSTSVFSLNTHAQVLAPLTKSCPPGFQAGAKLDSGLYQLTGTHLKVGDQASDDVPDPAPPYIGPKGEVEIYGSSLTFVRYPSWQEFEAGGCFEMVPLDLVQDNLVGYPDLYSRPWDVRKFRIEPSAKPAFEIIIAGTMSRTGTRDFPLWPEDNPNRRLFFYRKDPSGRWVRDQKPIVGKVEDAWVGHSYGGNIVQVGMKDQNVVRPDDAGEIALFYEKVSDSTNNSPYKTEIFATKMTSFEAVGTEPEIPIVQVNTPAYPSLKRTTGGFLAEGPRPIEMTIKGKRFFIVAFSSGDFPTDSYTLNYAWSENLLGPYKPALTDDETDLRDLGKEIKLHYGLSWMGRPSIYKSPAGDYGILFHAVTKAIRPENDYKVWPPELLGYYRSLFRVTLEMSLNAKGEPVLALNPKRAAK